MYIHAQQNPVFAAYSPGGGLAPSNLDMAKSSLTAAQKTACAKVRSLLPNMPWVSSPECGVFPTCPAAADCPAALDCPSCPDVSSFKSDVPVTGVKWWWLVVAGAAGAVVGAGAVVAMRKKP